MGPLPLTQVTQVYLIETTDFEDVLKELLKRSQPLDLKHEQLKHEAICKLYCGKIACSRSVPSITFCFTKATETD